MRHLIRLSSCAAALVIAACGSSTNPDFIDQPGPGDGATGALKVLSNRADLINGGDALVELAAPAAKADGYSVRLNGQDMTPTFKQLPDGRIVGLVSGLTLGPNVVTAQVGSVNSSVTIVNHPYSGPVIAGPQLQPWTCRNEAAVDDNCNQEPEFAYWYKSTSILKNGLQPYDPANPPSDVASTTTDNGVTLPFIVREETGYQDRDQYKIAVLFQPDQPWSATEPQPQFNHKLLITHGVACGVDYQTGGAPSVTSYNPADLTGSGMIPSQLVADSVEYALGTGYAVMSTALDYSGHNCNVALQAESLMMAKERLIEQYGTLRYTIGTGCSGGSLAQQWIANAYPGIYQGILPTCSFADAWGTATQFLDYHLTLAYFLDQSKWGSGIVWLPTQMADVQGHLTIANSLVSDNAQFHVAVPTDACAGVSDEERYHPQDNPGGVRCSIQDAAINLFGPRPESDWGEQERAIGRGFAGIPMDNVGVQYGLQSLQSLMITPDQFVDLNEKIGGLDIDVNLVPTRLAATRTALANAYRTGMINETNNLDQTAIIDCRGPDPALFHDSYRAFTIRARLDREHGSHANQLIWEGPAPIVADTQCSKNSFIAMDRWLAAVEQDESEAPIAQKVVDNKPVDITDACWDGLGQQLLNDLCGEAVVPIYGTPRMVAGDAITTDANKCQLKPIDPTEYGPIGLSAAQLARLQEIFPDGVCDFSQPGVDQQGTIPWQTYGDAINVIYGGEPLPPAKLAEGWVSAAFR
jgi:hypothetical protein